MKYRVIELRREISWQPDWQHVDTTVPRAKWRYEDPEYEITRDPGDCVYVLRRRWMRDGVPREETAEVPVVAVAFAVRLQEAVKQRIPASELMSFPTDAGKQGKGRR